MRGEHSLSTVISFLTKMAFIGYIYIYKLITLIKSDSKDLPQNICLYFYGFLKILLRLLLKIQLCITGKKQTFYNILNRN